MSPKQGAIWAGSIAVAGFASYKRPRLMLKLAGGAAAIEAGCRVAAAAMTAQWVQFGAYLDKATRLMEKENE